MIEHHGSLENEVIVWFGDGNNVANSWIEAAALLGLVAACRAKAYHPSAHLIAWAREKGANIIVTQDAPNAARNTSVLVKMSGSQWVMMKAWFEDLKPFQVTQTLLNLAQPDALFLHCLPAVREQEVTAEVIDGRNRCV